METNGHARGRKRETKGKEEKKAGREGEGRVRGRDGRGRAALTYRALCGSAGGEGHENLRQ
jgi:hypothetical protein